MKVQGAAISMSGKRFAIVVVGPQITQNSGEADMAIESMQPAFGGVPVVLMSQNEQGSPTYYGDQDLVSLLADVPIDKMPWKEYDIA